MRNENELRIVVVWALIGVFVGLALTPWSSGSVARPFWLGVAGAVLGYALVLRLRWQQR